jgi:2,4-dienoyl-CoA reductase (NADPH2)
LIEVFLKPYLLWWLEDHGTEFVTEVQLKEVNRQGLVVTMKGGSERTLRADTIITALPLTPNSELEQQMAGKAPIVHTIGDARSPALIFEAVADGAQIARAI